MSQYGKSFPQSIAEHLRLVDISWQHKMVDQMIKFGHGLASCDDSGKIVGHNYTEVFIDEAPDIGSGIAGILLPNDTVSYFSYAAPRLSFLAKCLRQCFTLQQENTYVQNA
ncbi:hypothetical protein [Arsukibacterium indicum]|uniref:IclR-ED domain-containing protein n=1 Tax=Arsukibacterium indicum TaxID=2848612 RepID=A0ABS6MHS4_9GAMM|nr:hypothetical protein [Arsukibacterium indicum]MBV2128175.1 hypothetical protein [Arsukibacterium indicum]